MLLAEVLIRKRDIEKKVSGLKEHLRQLALDGSKEDTSEVDEMVTKIYALLDEHQQQVFTIDRLNSSVKIQIGNSTTTLASAVRLRETIERKISVLDGLIEAVSCNTRSKFSISELFDNRDKLLTEYNILTSAIRTKDWTVELDDGS